MITLTPTAIAQIKLSAKQNKSSDLALRIAATRNSDNSIHYGMGFDELKNEDITIKVEDVNLIVSKVSEKLLKDVTIDFVEIEPDKFQFIFLNPNDPNYKPPTA